MTVLYACESGSRGGASPRPTATDVRFVYVHRLPWYLTVLPGATSSSNRSAAIWTSTVGTCARRWACLRDSNPTLLEWLRSPIVYRAVERWRLCAPRGAVRGYHHYVSMARKNLREHLLGEVVRYKKYLYVLRLLLAARWIRRARRPCASPSWRARW